MSVGLVYGLVPSMNSTMEHHKGDAPSVELYIT
jgi:hypothetical protein